MDPFSPLPLLSSQSSSAPAGTTASLSDNFMSFNSPTVGTDSESMLKPEKGNPGVLDPSVSVRAIETGASPLLDAPNAPQPSTPFDISQLGNHFAFDNNLLGPIDAIEDPFDYAEKKATQDANDPFEMVLAAAKLSEKQMKIQASPLSSHNSVESQNSLMNAAFYASRTNVSFEFANLNLVDSGDFVSAKNIQSKPQEDPRINKEGAALTCEVSEGEEWIENEIPPWEDNKDTLLDPDEQFLSETVKRVSDEFPKTYFSTVEDLDTSVVDRLKLKSPNLKLVPEPTLLPSVEVLKVPNLGLRSIDLSFLDSNVKLEESETVLPSEGESLDEWKKHIRERATGFISARKHSTSVKPFSKPLGSIDVNSPSGPRVSTPVKPTQSAFKSSLPTLTFKSRLVKPRVYGANKENA